MKRHRPRVLAVVVAAGLAAASMLACRKRSATPAWSLSALPQPPRGLPAWTDPPGRPSTLPKVVLGRALFFDPLMSADEFMTCNDCHAADHGWSGRDHASVNVFGKRTRRRSPAVINEGYATSFTWDGRAKTLEDACKIGWTTQLGADPESVAKRLDAVPSYRALFADAFGAAPSGDRILEALAAYLRVLATGDAPYDRFLAGDAGAMSEAAKRGEVTFRELGCASCHAPPLFSDYAFHNVGVGLASVPPDRGREESTHDPADLGKFRTPSLRDVAKLGPFFHDGSAATLDDAIALMARGGVPNPNLDPLLRPRTPTSKQLADLRAFLEALSGTPTLTPPTELPGGRPRG